MGEGVFGVTGAVWNLVASTPRPGYLAPIRIARHVGGRTAPFLPKAAGAGKEAEMPASFAARSSTSVVFEGVAASAGLARQLIRDVLPGCPRLDDCQLVATELIANAVRHSASGNEGGTLLLTILLGDDLVRIEVEDQGNGMQPGDWHRKATLAAGPAPGHHDADADDGRGLYLVRAIADESGHEATGSYGHLAWAQLRVAGTGTGSLGAGTGFTAMIE
jgi:anti-sigma regulatory factor (Ser/Thr protein kinase)